MFKILLALLYVIQLSDAHAFDPEFLINNKESFSRVLKSSHYTYADEWVESIGDRSLAITKAKSFLSNVLLQMKSRDAVCDLGLIELMETAGIQDNTLRTKKDLKAVASLLRIENQIDDLLFENILNSQLLHQNLKWNLGNRYPKLPPLNRNNNSTSDIDLKETFKEFKIWPNEIDRCSLGAYFRLSLGLTYKDTKDRDQLLRRLNYLALENKVITLETYHKLETFRLNKALDWPVHLAAFMDISSNAKDRLSPTGKPFLDPASYSTKYADRKQKLTHRERLYKNFNSTQVMILAGIMEKTAKRMDASRVSINFQYTTDSEISETYVLSPLEKYRLSLKMLRKDMAEAMRSEIFGGKSIEYVDLVTAAYETGYIKAEELELILQFEDFWNPKTPKWKTYSNFAFSLVGTAAWFLPPPWNIVGAIALVVAQSKLVNGKEPADADDNWNVVL